MVMIYISYNFISNCIIYVFQNSYTAEVGRRVMGELKKLERQLLDAGLMPEDG